MKRRYIGVFFSLVLVLGTVPASSAGGSPVRQGDIGRLQDVLWLEVEGASVAKDDDRRLVVPQAYRVFLLNERMLVELLARTPLESSAAATQSAVVMGLPMPDGTLARFRIQESPIMEPALAAQFPLIRTFVAQGIDDPTATVRFDYTPTGLHAIVLSARGTVYIDPYRRGDTTTYITYNKRDFRKEGARFECLVGGGGGDDTSSKRLPTVTQSGEALRTYRAAVAATGEYTQFHGGTVEGGLAAVVTSVNRVTAIYERELAIRLVLVGGNAAIVFTNAATDPYTNDDGFAMLSENQTTLTNVIGSPNYDIGHVLSTGGGGVATLRCVCLSGSKARGVTGSSQPIGDPFDVDYVAHEMGHQFGGNHTFNGTSGNCFRNRVPSAAYEPGSGSTIMGYAGICSSQDLQPNSDDYFHAKSFDEIIAYTNAGGGNGCAAQTPTGNLPPTVEAGASYTIPRSTPFALTAIGGDPNGDAITYCWEQFDLGAAAPPDTDNGFRPIFRSFDPVTSPTRTFPTLGAVLSNTPAYGESLPTTNRTMNFRATVRDNRAGGSGVAFDSTQVTVTAGAGPFAVTHPSVATTWVGGSSQVVMWDVANTNAAPVNCANVRITLSTDGGNTFPIEIAASTPNDGTETVRVPNAATAAARVKVEAVGNIFFDMSNANVTISAGVSADTVGIYSPSSGAWFLRNANASGSADLTYGFGPAAAGFVPVAGDWNADGGDTVGVYDPATGAFFLRDVHAAGQGDASFSFGPGGAGWIPVAGDWNGDGIDTIGLFDPVNSVFFLKNTNTYGPADIFFSFGPAGAGWKPIVGDWDGNGVDSVGLYSPSTGAFFLKNVNSGGPADATFAYGPTDLTPIAGDWNADNADTIGVYGSATGAWFLRNTNTPGPGDVVFGYGPPGATPLAGDWDGF